MKHTVLLYLSALVVPLMAACTSEGDDTRAYDRFALHTRVGDANASAKTSWDVDGLWWDEGDWINVNGTEFQIKKVNGTWFAIGEETPADASGNFNICYPSSGSFDINNGQVPLASVTTGNNATLNPCCAVVRVSGDIYDGYEMELNDLEGDVYESGSIDISSASISSGSTTDVVYGMEEPDGYVYFIIPMGQSEISCYLSWEFSYETNPITIKKGYLYTVEL